VTRGFLDGDEVTAFLAGTAGGACYLSGPQPFMDVVEAALLGAGAGPERVHIERFPPPAPVTGTAGQAGGAAAAGGATGPVTVTVELDGPSGTAYRPGTLLQTARQLGLPPLSSCEAGNCATCMARLVEGRVVMHANSALTEDGVADGWVLPAGPCPPRRRYGLSTVTRGLT